MVIQRAEVVLAVRRPADLLDELGGLAEVMGGYVEKRQAATVVLRVPSARFRATLLRVGKAGQVLQQRIESEEVTDQMQDLEARLRNAQAVRERIVRLLAATHNIQEALQLERELARVTESLEVLKGKLALLGSRVAMATLAVTAQGLPAEVAPPPPPPPRQVSPFSWLSEVGLSRLLDLPSRR
jgi:hypothetical protein